MDPVTQEVPPLREWAATPELFVGAVVAVLTAIYFWQTWYLAVKYERRGLQKRIARSLFKNEVCLFLGCGIISASALWSALWLEVGRYERPSPVQLALPLISPLPIGVSILTTLRFLANMKEVLKEKKLIPETESAVYGIHKKWCFGCYFSFISSLRVAFFSVGYGIGRFFEKDFYTGTFMYTAGHDLDYGPFFLAAMVIVAYLYWRGILGLVSIVSLASLLSIVSKCIMIYIYYQDEDLTRSNSEWLLNTIFDAMTVTAFLFFLILSNMTGSVFYAAYEVTIASMKAPLDDQEEEAESTPLLESH